MAEAARIIAIAGLEIWSAPKTGATGCGATSAAVQENAAPAPHRAMSRSSIFKSNCADIVRAFRQALPTVSGARQPSKRSFGFNAPMGLCLMVSMDRPPRRPSPAAQTGGVHEGDGSRERDKWFSGGDEHWSAYSRLTISWGWVATKSYGAIHGSFTQFPQNKPLNIGNIYNTNCLYV